MKNMQLFSTPTVTTLLVDHTERGTQKCLHSKTPNSDFRVYVREADQMPWKLCICG